MITLHFYNTITQQHQIVPTTINIYNYTTVGELINLKAHTIEYVENEYRKVLDVKYDGSVKEIHLSGHKY